METRSLRTGTLRAAILASIGAAAIAAQGCDDGTGTGGAGGSSSTSGSSSSGKGSTSSTTASGSTTTTGTGSTTASGTTTTGTGSTSASTGSGMMNVQRCFPNGAGASCPETAKAEMTFGNCTSNLEMVTMWISGPTVMGTDCCYEVNVTDPGDPNCGVIGRPLVVAEAPRKASIGFAAPADTSGWRATSLTPGVDDLDEAARLALARAWADDAAYEHASVAAFSKTALELMALGAPRELVEGCHRAALDEIQHASMGFALASAYAGAVVQPGRFPEAIDVAFARDLASLAAAAVKEGCVGETLAALVAGAQRDAATDGAVKTALLQIAADEARHAELSWAIVAWAVREGGDDVRDAVGAAFDAQIAIEREAIAAASASASSASLEAHGRLPTAEIAREKARGLEDVVLPAMRALLG